MSTAVTVVSFGVPLARLEVVEREVRGRRPAPTPPASTVPDVVVDGVREVSRVIRAPGGRVRVRLTVAAAGPHCVAQVTLETLGAPSGAVIDLARRWLVRHHLWLDPTSLDARLAAEVSGGSVPAVRRVAVDLQSGMGVDQALREMVHGCLVQIVGNLGPLASGVGTAEHVHQARVAIRRARTVVRELGGSSGALDPAWSDGLADLFRCLGTSRDREVVVGRWIDQLIAAGGPELAPTADHVDDPADVARSTAHGLLLLDLLAYAVGAPAESDETIEAVAAARLARLHQRIARDARRFTEASVAERHATRKRLKRLRYLAELTGPVFRTRRVKRFVKALEPAQAALGEFNDLAVAEAWFRARVGEDPAAWFAVGWLAAHEPHVVAACVRPLRDVADVEPYWS